MFTINIRLEKKKENKWSRKYITLSQGLSQIGGIYQALLALGYFCLFPISQFELNRKLMNQIFSFENSCKQQSQIKQLQENEYKGKTDSIAKKLKDEQDSKSIALCKEIQSYISNANGHRELNGTFQILSQNSIQNNHNNQYKSMQKFDSNNHTILKQPRNSILINDNNNVYHQANRNIDESQNNENQQKMKKVDIFKQKLNMIDLSTSPFQRINVSPINNFTSPTSQLNSFQGKISDFPQKYLSPNSKFRSNKQKSQTLFINKLYTNSPRSQIFQRSMLFGQNSSNNTNTNQNKKTLQNKTTGVEEINHSPAITNNSKENNNNHNNMNNIFDSNSNNNVIKHNPQHTCESPTKKEQKELKNKLKKNKTLLKDINLTANRIKLSLWEYIRYFICPPRSLQIKKKQMNYGMEKLYHHLDIVYVLKKLTEIDKLKILLLNQQQMKLFEYIPRPQILTDQNDEQDYYQMFNFLYEDKRTEIERAYDAYESFKAMTQDDYIQTSQDRKLLNMVDPHLFDLFANSNDILQQNHIHQDDFTVKDYTEINNLNIQTIVSPQNLSQVPKVRYSVFQSANDCINHNHEDINNNLSHNNINHIHHNRQNNLDTNHQNNLDKINSQNEIEIPAENNNRFYKEETLEDTEKGSYYQKSLSESNEEKNSEIRVKMQEFQKKIFKNLIVPDTPLFNSL